MLLSGFLSGGGPSVGVIIAAVIVSVLVIVVITTITMCLILRKKKKNLKRKERCAQLSDAFSKGLCCSNVDKPSTGKHHSL